MKGLFPALRAALARDGDRYAVPAGPLLAAVGRGPLSAAEMASVRAFGRAVHG